MDNKTICWSCKNAVCGCSWSKRFEPVKGWTATLTKLKGYSSGQIIESYNVIKCPEYVPDHKPVIKENITEISGKVNKELVYRLSEIISQKIKQGASCYGLAKSCGTSLLTIQNLHLKKQKGMHAATYCRIKSKLEEHKNDC